MSATLSDEVRVELIELLFSALLPVVTMAFAFAATAALLVWMTGDVILAGLAALGFLASGCRIAIILLFGRVASRSGHSVEFTLAWEKRLAIATFLFALMLGAFGARAFSLNSPAADMLVTALAFAYGAGVVTRNSVRPAIAIPSLVLAATPMLVALAFQQSPAHWALLGLLALFTTASFESVRHSYRTTVRQIEMRQEMAGLARHDNLTGLANRLQLRERLSHSLKEAGHHHTLVGIHYVDLDLFKQVNDQYGHPTGDALLVAVAQRLVGLTREGDTVGRMGGDEFLVIQADIKHRDEAEILARRIIREVSAPFIVDGASLQISASIGISVAPRDGRMVDTLIGAADQALYGSKGEGRGSFSFCPDLHVKLVHSSP